MSVFLDVVYHIRICYFAQFLGRLLICDNMLCTHRSRRGEITKEKKREKSFCKLLLTSSDCSAVSNGQVSDEL